MAIVITGLVFLLAGIPFLWLAKRGFARNGAIKKWPRAEGVITSATLETRQSRVTDKNTGLYHYSTYYTPSLRYTYTVGVETFEGKDIALALGNVSTTEASAKKILEPYPVGARVGVLYDPADPKTAYLEVRTSIGAIILLGMGAVFVAIGAFVMTRAL